MKTKFTSLFTNAEFDYASSDVNKNLQEFWHGGKELLTGVGESVGKALSGNIEEAPSSFLQDINHLTKTGTNKNLVGSVGGLLKADWKFNNAERAHETLKNLRSAADILTDTSPQDVLTELKDMGMGQINRKVNSLMQRHEKKIRLAKDIYNTGAKIARKFGFNIKGVDFSTWGNASNALREFFSHNDVQKELTPDLASKLETYDPLYGGTKGKYQSGGINGPVDDFQMDLTDLLKIYAEDCGYVMDKWRSIRFARDYCFVQRPALESDSGGYHRTFAWLTRPNCNLVQMDQNHNLDLVPGLERYPDLLQLVHTDPTLYAELCRDGSGKGNLFYFLSNYIKEVPYIKLPESNREGIQNMYGKSTPLPGIPEIYNEVDIPITFIDNDRGDVAHLLYTLSMYKNYVSKDGYSTRPEYIKYKGIDYLMSLYIAHVNTNWEIVGFGVAIGLMIADPPTHFTQHKIDGFSKSEIMDDFTVTFKASTYIPYAPQYYDIFNMITGFDPGNIVDTRGSSSTIQATGRTANPTPRAAATSVFSQNGGYGASTARAGVPSNILPDQRKAGSGGGTGKFGTVQEAAAVPFQDTFEFVAKAPGIYTAVNSNEPHRRIFRLGFSY